MPEMIQLVLLFLVGYMVGNINGGYVLVKLIKKVDIRQQFSGNAGARNAYRILGKSGFAGTVLIDGLKTIFVYVGVTYFFHGWDLATVVAVLGVFIGHCYPILLGFRGGMGIVVYLASALVVVPWSIVAMIVVALVLYQIIKHKTIAGLIGVACIPVMCYFNPISIEWKTYFICLFIFIVLLSIFKKKRTEEAE